MNGSKEQAALSAAAYLWNSYKLKLPSLVNETIIGFMNCVKGYRAMDSSGVCT